MNLEFFKWSPKKIAKIVKGVQDKFTLYVAGFFLLIFLVAGFYTYQYRFSGRNPTNLAYVELRQTLLNDQGVIARMAVNVQVNTADEDWLKENEAAINAQFQKEVSAMDVEAFRTKEGFTEIQEELKRKLNLEFNTDKIQNVLVTELILQNQR